LQRRTSAVRRKASLDLKLRKAFLLHPRHIGLWDCEREEAWEKVFSNEIRITIRPMQER
jgi:hypothetical protein